MTQTRSSLKSKGPIVTPSYLFYSVKRSWAVMLLIFIAMLLSVTVPIIMQSQSLYEWIETETLGYGLSSTITVDDMHNRMQNTLGTVGGFLLAVSVLSAVFSGCMSFSFIHNKVSAGFFHSLPERRSGHFISALTASLVSYLLPLAVNMGISLLSVAAFGLLDGFVLAVFSKVILLNIFYYIVFLAITFFAGSLSGTMPIHAIFTVYFTAVLPVLFWSVMIWINEGARYIQAGDLMASVEILNALSPIMRMITVYPIIGGSLITGTVIGCIIFDSFISVLLFVLSYFIYATRPTERAGTPVIYKCVSDAVKYTIIFASSLLLAYLFAEVGGGVWMIFGLVAGAVLMFMLCNTVLNRTPKAMFKGLRGFAICFAVTVFVFIYAGTAGFGTLDEMIPQANSITITINGETYTVREKEAVKELRRNIDDMLDFVDDHGLDTNDDSIIYPEGSAEYYYYGTVAVPDDKDYIKYNTEKEKDYQAIASGSVRGVRVQAVYSTPYGIDIPYSYRNIPYEAATAMIATLEAYGEPYYDMNEILADENTFLQSMNISFFVKNDGELFPTEVYEEKKEINEGPLSVNIEFIDFLFDTEAEEAAFRKEVLETKLARFLSEHRSNDNNSQIIGYFNMAISVDREYRDYRYLMSEVYPLYAEDIAIICDMLTEYTETIYIYVHNGYGVYNSYDHSFEEKLATVNKIADLSPDYYVEAQAELVDFVVVCDRETNKIYTVNERDKINEIMKSVISLDEQNSTNISPFTKTDSRYGICVVMSEFFNNYYTTYFIDGKAPAFLK